MNIKIAIASDHAGYTLKEALKTALKAQGASPIEWSDFGPSSDARTDYPDFAKLVADAVATAKIPQGVLICGSGIGMSIAANKVHGIRAAVVESVETARLSKAHNNANILCLGARIVSPERAIEMVKIWLSTAFEEGRHSDRIEKIRKLETT